MIDRKRLAEVAARCRGGEVLSEDIEWLLESLERLADDNQRLARLVADITQIVEDAKQRRAGAVTEMIDAALDRARDEDN